MESTPRMMEKMEGDGEESGPRPEGLTVREGSRLLKAASRVGTGGVVRSR